MSATVEQTPTEIERAAASRNRFFEAVKWCKSNVPDQDAYLAASSAMMIRHSGRTLTADAVRDRLRAQGRAK